MTEPFSIYMDLIRAVAATVVFLGHAGLRQISGGLFYQFTAYGEPAVDVFFVLSGFVICFVATTREDSPLSYSVNRLARVYSVALPAIIISAVLDWFCRIASPTVYASFPAFLTDSTWKSYVLALVFSNHNWFGSTQPGMDGPYWSLCFEVWYYTAFGVAFFARGYRRLVLLIVIALIVGPKIWLLAPVWLLGVGCFRLCRRIQVRQDAGFALAILPVISFFIWYTRIAAPRSDYPFTQFHLSLEWIWNTRFDLIVGILFAAHLWGMNSICHRFKWVLTTVARPVRFVAGSSFTLYLIHYPLIHFWVCVSQWGITDWRTRSLIFIVTPALLMMLAFATEKQKGNWRRFFAWMIHSASLVTLELRRSQLLRARSPSQ